MIGHTQVSLCILISLARLIIDIDLPVPLDVEHYVIWSRVPAISSANIPVAIQPLVKEDGLWGFTGTEGGDEAIHPPGIEPKVMTESEKVFFAEACHEFDKYVKQRWPEDAWECAWFVNPPVSAKNSSQRRTQPISATPERSGIGTHSCFRAEEVIRIDNNLRI